MAEAAACDFDEWLRDTLVALDTDDEVFSPYIKGILEGEENPDEKLEALQGILSEITENGIDDLCQDILRKWKLSETNGPTEAPPQVAADERLARIMGEQAQMVVTARVRTQEEENLKSAILAQYAQVSDGEVTDSDEEEVGTCNANVESVAREERERREKDKAESQRKKDKDKEDRAKQKAKDDERKEKEKKRTQKGERRRRKLKKEEIIAATAKNKP